MIGEIHFMKDRIYVESNRKGTWERLPTVRWYRQIQLFILSFNRRWTVNDTRDFCRRHQND